MKDLPVIVLSDDDSDAPVRIKRRRLVKNGAIVKKNNVQDGKKQTSTNEYQTRKRVPLIVISDDDDDELDEPIAKKQKTHLKKPKNTINNDIQRSFLDNKKLLPITNNKASVQEFQNMGTSKTKKKDLCSDSKTPTWNLIDEETDEEFTEYDEHTSPFDKNNVLPITNKKPYGKDLQNTGNWTLEIYLTRKLMMMKIQKGIDCLWCCSQQHRRNVLCVWIWRHWKDIPLQNNVSRITLTRSDLLKPLIGVFGVKVVGCRGDFRQILPVIPNASRNDVIQEFADWILNIGNGNNDSKNVGESTVEFPDEMIIPESDDYVGSIIAETYPKLLQNLWNPTFFQERAILAPTHEMVDIINERMMALIPGEETIYESSDSVSLVDDDTNFDDSIYTTDFLNGIKMSGLPKHAIKLKIGTPVMLMRNIDQKAGLCNGTRLQVLRMGINVIEGKIISGGSVGKICAIPRMPRANTITGGVVFTKASILTWAVVRGTIKSQSNTDLKVCA
ncbi:ATP-dependent DNA helicase PIF1-like protein [Tanacetum coccineum]